MIRVRTIVRSVILFTAAVTLPVNAEVAEVKDAPKKWTPEQIGWQSFPLKPDKTLEYKTVTGKDGVPFQLKLQVFLPEGWQASDKRPAAVFFHGGGWHGGGPDGFMHKLVQPYWKEISPIDHIDDKAPPTFVVLGTEDVYVPVATAKRYERLMKENGRRCDLHIYEGKKHGWYNLWVSRFWSLRSSHLIRFSTT